MSKEHDDELADQARLLIDLSEPEALLQTLSQAATAKAADKTQTLAEHKRWNALADILSEAQTKLTQQSENVAKPKTPQGELEAG